MRYACRGLNQSMHLAEARCNIPLGRGLTFAAPVATIELTNALKEGRYLWAVASESTPRNSALLALIASERRRPV